MLLTKLNEFSDKKVSCLGNSVYFQKFESNGIFVNYLNNNKTEWSLLFKIEDEYKDLIIWEDIVNNYTIVQTSNSKLYIIDKETGDLVYEDNKGVYAYDNNIFIERKKINNERKKKKYKLYQIYTTRIGMVSEIDSTSFSDIIINNILYTISDEKIIGYNLEFKPLWEISISQYNLANIFVFNDKLYLLKYENDRYTTLIYKNGKLESSYEDLGGHQVICSDNKIYYLSGDNIKILDLDTDSIINWNTEKVLEENKIGYLYFPKWAISKGKIFFTQSRGVDMHSGINGAKFGILDPEKKELLCSTQLAKSYGIIGGIQVSDDTVYLNTQSGALLVYTIEK